MRKSVKRAMFLIIPIIIMISLCSCEMISMKVIPAKKEQHLEKYLWAGEAHSTYAYERLDECLKPIYKDIAEACLSLQTKVNTGSASGKDLEIIFQAVTRDYPIINWLGDSYSYTDDAYGGVTLLIEYNMDKADANLMLTRLDGYTTLLLGEISPDSSDYEKALQVHDLLVNSVEYDLDAKNQRDAYGAIVDKRATCQGYAKAFQFLLLKLGIDSTVIFGDAGEPHAWNAVKLDNDYYYADVTFDDRQLTDGQPFLSREYLFLNAQEMGKTHTPDMAITVFSLPECSKSEQNFFIKNELIIDKADRYVIEATAKEQAVLAAKAGKTAFQLKFAETNILDEAETKHLSNGLVDTAIANELMKFSGVSYTGRVTEMKTNVVTFVLKYK